MSKIIKCILGCMLVFMVSGFKTTDTSNTERNIFDSDTFKVINEDFSSYGYNCLIVYHKENKVMYVVVFASHSCSITPLLNPDGTPMLYQGE